MSCAKGGVQTGRQTSNRPIQSDYLCLTFCKGDASTQTTAERAQSNEHSSPPYQQVAAFLRNDVSLTEEEDAQFDAQQEVNCTDSPGCKTVKHQRWFSRRGVRGGGGNGAPT